MRGSTWQRSEWVSHWRAESGQTMAEYATVLGILVIGVVVALGLLTMGVADKLQSDVTTIVSAM